MRTLLRFIGLLTLPFTALAEKPDTLFAHDNLVAWCIVPFDAKKRGPEERAAMLEELGIKHFAYDYRKEHILSWDAELDALQRHHIELTAWWFPTTLNDEAKKALVLFKTHGVKPQLWVSGGGEPTKDEAEQAARVESEAARIKTIAEAASAQGLQVALYNHGGWFGEPENQLAIIARLERDGITNVGMVYNLHHAHEQLDRLPQLLEKMKPHLLAWNLNGMTRGGEKILPLGQGELDLPLLKMIRNSGWRGPVGILNHTNEDAEVRLRDNLAGLDWLVAQLDGQPAGVQPVPTSERKAALGSAKNADWPSYLGNKDRSLYSALGQINRENVAQLKVAWTYETGDKGEYQANNLIVAGVLYTASPSRKVIALDAATGREIWKWDPATERSGAGKGRQRGLVFWQNDDGGEQRIFSASGNYLFALDPKTGTPIRTFGENGSIHLGSGLDTDKVPNVGLNTPGVTYRDSLIIGGIGGPGAVRAFDVRTGARRWIFHLIPRPGEVGYDTWPAEAYKTATGLMPWCGQSLDEKRGIVYVATKTAEPDFYGGERPGDNLFANSLVALDANTGQRLWHHQLVHHDLLDRDLPCPPVLLTVTHDGKKIDAVAQGSKQGLLFVFDRVSGEPLWPIEEKPMPSSELRGEMASPTQPIPTKPAPLMRQSYTMEDISTTSPEATLLTVNKVQSSPNLGPFPAPSIKETIMFPGFDGGMEWGGGAADPEGIYYVNVNEMPWIMQMVETRNADGTPLARGKKEYMLNCAACHGLDFTGNLQSGFPSLVDVLKRKTREQMAQVTKQGAGRMPAFDRLSDGEREGILDYVLGVTPPPATGRADEAPAAAPAKDRKDPPYAFAGFRRFLDKEGYPAIKPPWGTLNAVDLNTGELKWKVPLGEYPALTARGLPPTGTENYGGPVVTAGGLIFIAATADETIRAFDKDTGKILWQAPLPFGGNATPSIYMVDGRQYVVINAGGGKSGRPTGGSIVAFALPAGL